MNALMSTPPPAEHPGEGFEGWFWSSERREWFKTAKTAPATPTVLQHGGKMRVHFDGENYQELIDQMGEAIDEWEGRGAQDGAALTPATPGAETPKKRGRKPKLQALTQPGAPLPTAPPQTLPAATGDPNKVWNVCQFHAQATAKAGRPSHGVAPHECDGCRVMAQGKSFEAELGLGAAGPAPTIASTIAAAGAVHSPAAVTSATGMTVDNVKAVMRELVQAKIKATGAKTDAEIEAAAKPIGDWLGANFKNAAGAPCQMASEIQPSDYHRFNAEALKLAEASAPKKSMFD